MEIDDVVISEGGCEEVFIFGDVTKNGQHCSVSLELAPEAKGKRGTVGLCMALGSSDSHDGG